MTTDDKLKPLREQIDAIDALILDLLNRRARVAQEVGHVKAETNAPAVSYTHLTLPTTPYV